MKKFNCFAIAMTAVSLMVAPAFAQAPATQVQQQQQPNGNAANAAASATGAPRSQYPSGASKQQTQGDLPEVGPASKAYYGNTVHSNE